MALYLLKFSACLLIFLAFYKVMLEKENMHVFKRFYLLGALVLAIIIPLVTFTQYIEPISPSINEFSQDILITDNFDETQTSIRFLPYSIWAIYIIGVCLFGVKFFSNLYRLHYRIKHNPKQRHLKFTHVLLKDLIVPHTFFNYIFFNKHKFETNDIPEEVFWHEQTHASQKHSMDVIFIEALQVLLWFNPLIYIIKHAIKLNHEFLADQGVLQKGIKTNTYQEIILTFSSNASQPQLANAINYSLIKKRFTVMKTQTTKQSVWLRSFILLPLLALMLYSFSDTKIVEKNITETDSLLYSTNNKEGATKAMMKEYTAFIETFEATNIVDMQKYNRAAAIYDIMTIEQKKSVKKLPKVPTVNLSKTKVKKPNKSEFNAWKNDKKFAIWIDGKHVPNTVLNNYTLEDISHYTGSFVHNNARSKKFPQPYQYHIYTKKGFENTYKNSNVNTYKTLAKKYTDALNIWLKGNRTDNSELRILKAQADKAYASLLQEDISKHNILPTPPLPAPNKNEQQKATKAQIKEYNTLAKKYNNMSKDEMYVKKSDIERLKYIYSIMSVAQRKDAEPFPNIPEPPAPKTPRVIEVESAIPPPPPPIPADATPEQIEKYKKVTDEYYKKYSVKKGKVYRKPPPPPIPENATPAQRKKYEESIRKYEIAVAKSRQDRARVREITDIERAKLIKAKEAHVSQQKVLREKKLARVAEVKHRQEKLKQEKLQRLTERQAISEERRAQLAKVKVRDVKERQIEKEKRQAILLKEKLKHVEERKVLKEQKREHAIAEKLKRQEERLQRDLPPPPPPPKSPMDHVIDMAKKDATFYFDGKKITSDEAIKKLKENNKINIRTYNRDSNSPKVYLSTKPIVVETIEKN